ncbi:MAG: acyltransferase [Pseudomonadota bacterium]
MFSQDTFVADYHYRIYYYRIINGDSMRATDKASPLTESFSLYLDLTRFVAALLVVLAHYLQYGIVNGNLAGVVPNMGREAVVIFFVLSGFVIAYVTESRVTTAREYVAARCGRIYSVVLPTLVFAWLLASVMGLGGVYQLAKPYIYIPLHLLFLGQSWTLSEVPPLLAPFWSLCYEVWFYVLFGVIYYLKGWRRIVVAIVVLGVMGYKLWLLLPVWISGVVLYHLQQRLVLTKSAARLGFVVSLSLLVLYNLAGAELLLRKLASASWPFSSLPLASAERFLGDYVVCVLVLANFLCARFADLSGLLRYGTHIRTLASYTFTLYLSHMMVVLAWQKIFSHTNGTLYAMAGLTAAIGMVTIVLAQITERRKATFRQPFDWLLKQTIPAKA